MSEDSGQVSGLLQQRVKDDYGALDALAPVPYQELRIFACYHSGCVGK
jgi:hypothetical protein